MLPFMHHSSSLSYFSLTFAPHLRDNLNWYCIAVIAPATLAWIFFVYLWHYLLIYFFCLVQASLSHYRFLQFAPVIAKWSYAFFPSDPWWIEKIFTYFFIYFLHERIMQSGVRSAVEIYVIWYHHGISIEIIPKGLLTPYGIMRYLQWAPL